MVWALRRRHEAFAVTVCSTAQHREMLDRVQRALDLAPDLDLDLMRPDQGLNELAARVLVEMDRTLVALAPDWLAVQASICLRHFSEKDL